MLQKNFTIIIIIIIIITIIIIKAHIVPKILILQYGLCQRG